MKATFLVRHPVTRYYYNAGYPDVLCSWFQSFLRQLKYNPGFMAWVFFPIVFNLRSINQPSEQVEISVFVYLTYCLTNKNHVLTENGDDPWWECDYWLLDLTDPQTLDRFFSLWEWFCVRQISVGIQVSLYLSRKSYTMPRSKGMKKWRLPDISDIR